MFECEFCGSPNPVWLSIPQLANLLHVTKAEARRLCSVGLVPGAEKVPGLNMKGHWRVPAAKAVRYFQERNGTL